MKFANDRLVINSEAPVGNGFLAQNIHWMLTNVGLKKWTDSSSMASYINMKGKIEAVVPSYMPFIFERTSYFNELVPQFYLQFNDVVNSKTDSAGVLATEQLNAINRIGNFKLNSKRNIFHIGDGFDQRIISNMKIYLDDTDKVQTIFNFPDFIPLYPPNELIGFYETSPVTHEYLTSRIQLTATDTGYKHYIKSNHPDLPTKTATERWAFETRESSGYKSVVISPYLDNGTSVNTEFILGAVQAGKDMSSATGSTDWDALGNVLPTAAHTNLDVPDIEAVMDRVYSEIGDAMGTWLPDPDSHTWINQKGQVKMKLFHASPSHASDTTDSLSFLLRTYAPTMTEATLLSSMEVNRDTGSFLWTNVNNTVEISYDLASGAEEIVLTAGNAVITMDVTAGSITMTDGVSTFLMDGTNIKLTGDVLIVGSLDVS